MSRLHRRLKFLRNDLSEVAAFALAVRIFLDRSGFLISFSSAELSTWMRLMTEGARKAMWCQNRRFQLTRLETRTKESTHIRKCVGIMPICIVNVTVVIYAAPFDLYLRREV